MAEDTLQTLLDRIGGRGAAPAIIAFTGTGFEETSFAELAARARGLARELARRGIGPGTGVALIAPNSTAWIVAFWAWLIKIPFDLTFSIRLFVMKMLLDVVEPRSVQIPKTPASWIWLS